MLYRYRQAQVICGNTKTEPFIIQTADAYSLRSYFSLCIDWIIKSATKDQRGMWWTLYHLLSDLHLVDEISLKRHPHTDMEAMTNALVSTALIFGFKGSQKGSQPL